MSNDRTVPRRETPATRQIRRAAWVGLAGNLLLSGIKMVAGFLGQSHAVVADAVHSLTDVATDLAVLFGVRFWSAPADVDHPHGHRRIETLVTVAIGLFLGAVGVGIGIDAIHGLGEENLSEPSTIALVGALISIVSKEWLYRWTVGIGRQVGSPALVANAWHHRSDALSSLPVALAVVVALVAPRWVVIDLVGAAVVSVFILHAAWRILSPATAQLIDVGAPERDRLRIEELALSVSGVHSAHALRTRYSGSKLAVDLHVEVDADLTVREGHQIARAVRKTLIDQGPDIIDVMVQVEPIRE